MNERLALLSGVLGAMLIAPPMALAQPARTSPAPLREPPPPGRRISARDGDLVVVDHDARVGFVRRRPATIRVVYNAAERWIVMLADFAPPNGNPDGVVDFRYNWRQVEGTWPLEERWEGSAILEEFTAPNSEPSAFAIQLPHGRVQFLNANPAESMFADPQSIATIRYRGAGSAMDRQNDFDRAEQQIIRETMANARDASGASFNTFGGPGGIQGSVAMQGGVAGMASAPVRSGPEPNAPYRVGGGITPPRKVHDAAAVYPPSMLQTGIAGTVIVEVTVDVDGSVRSVRPLRTLGVPQLDQAAVDAVKQWRYEPATLNGTAVPVVLTATVVIRP